MYGSSTGERGVLLVFPHGDDRWRATIPGRNFSETRNRRFPHGLLWSVAGTMARAKEITFGKPGHSMKTLRVSCPNAGPLEVSVALTPRR